MMGGDWTRHVGLLGNKKPGDGCKAVHLGNLDPGGGKGEREGRRPFQQESGLNQDFQTRV